MSSSTASKLDALAGLESAKRIVRRLVGSESGVHSVLLYGAEGSGKEVLAELLAEAWLCQSPGPDGAEGECQACRSYQRGTTPDVLHLRPVGASSIMRQGAILGGDEDYPQGLIPFLRTPPLMSRHKVAILHQADRMQGAASNSLLKTLEEPFPYAKLILTTSSPSGVLPTILSRCVAIACALPTLGEVREKFPAANDDDLLISDGAPGRLADVLERPERYRRIAEFARSLPKRASGEALVVSSEFRDLADGLGTAKETGARAAHAEAIATLATCLAAADGNPPHWTAHVIEAHRRILGNASAGLTFDALFTYLLTNR